MCNNLTVRTVSRGQVGIQIFNSRAKIFTALLSLREITCTVFPVQILKLALLQILASSSLPCLLCLALGELL